MYFFSEEERKYLLKKLIPSSRERMIAEDLRGWNWQAPELSPPHDVVLPLWEVAENYCETGRDSYLQHVEKIAVPPSEQMVQGLVYHKAVSDLYSMSKKLIYCKGVAVCPDLSSLLKRRFPEVSEMAKKRLDCIKVSDEACSKVLVNLEKLWSFEVSRIVSSVYSYVSKYRNIGEDSLVHHALPFVVEHKLDGRYFGLGCNLSADAINIGGLLVCDLKTGERRDFHKLTSTGYALVYESLYDVPVNIGCVVYLSFPSDNPAPHINRDFFIISDELRQWFIEERDRREEIIFAGKDPGICKKPGSCRYKAYCIK
jgi:CRISPR-associated protein Csa1